MKEKTDEKHWTPGASLASVHILGSVVDWGYVFVLSNTSFTLGFKAV